MAGHQDNGPCAQGPITRTLLRVSESTLHFPRPAHEEAHGAAAEGRAGLQDLHGLHEHRRHQDLQEQGDETRAKENGDGVGVTHLGWGVSAGSCRHRS